MKRSAAEKQFNKDFENWTIWEFMHNRLESNGLDNKDAGIIMEKYISRSDVIALMGNWGKKSKWFKKRMDLSYTFVEVLWKDIITYALSWIRDYDSKKYRLVTETLKKEKRKLGDNK